MDNKLYFKYSQEHDDQIVDFSRQKGVLVINENSTDVPTKLMEDNHKLIEYITTYKTLKGNNLSDEKTLNNVIDKIIYLIESANLINYTSFCVYLQVIGYSYSTYCAEKNKMDLDEKRELIKILVDLYIKNRHDMYLYHGYSDQVLQVQSDAASSRRKGKTGIEKMEDILLPLGFKKASSILQLENSGLYYLLPDKGDISLFNSFLKKNGIKFEFCETRDNKNPDMFLAVYGEFYIVEHKLTNGGGGSQNAEINEIIQFINYEEEKDNWHYISCLQGNFFKKLNKDNHEPKAEKQFINVNNNLSSHKGNFFVNGKGFEKLVSDLVEDKKPSKCH